MLSSAHRLEPMTDPDPRSESEANSSASKQLELDLAQTNALLQAIVENTTAAIFVKDRSGRYRLTLAKRLVEQHDGTLEVRSSGRDHGSELLIRLPAVTVEPDEPKETTMSSEPETHARRILVVDDNADAARGLAILLRSVGHEVRTALDGAQALEVARDFRPQIVFLDLGLPIVDGYQVAAQIRGEDFGQEVSLIALTGYGRQEDIERSLSVGFDRHLVKPIEFDKVHEIVNDLSRSR